MSSDTHGPHLSIDERQAIYRRAEQLQRRHRRLTGGVAAAALLVVGVAGVLIATQGTTGDDRYASATTTPSGPPESIAVYDPNHVSVGIRHQASCPAGTPVLTVTYRNEGDLPFSLDLVRVEAPTNATLLENRQLEPGETATASAVFAREEATALVSIEYVVNGRSEAERGAFLEGACR